MRFKAVRLGDGPIIHPGLCRSIGTNINGPSVICVPDWIEERLGKYYLYFADHRGSCIRLAYADNIAGPWSVHEPGSLSVEEGGFPGRVSELCPPIQSRKSVASGNLRPHVASPDVHVDHHRRLIVMHFHGLERDCSQTTRRVVSTDGVRFIAPRPTGADFYARVFNWRGETYAIALAGWLYRSTNGGLSFPERIHLGDRTIRHLSVFAYKRRLFLVFSRIGDSPERLLVSRVLTNGDWRNWRLCEHQELLRAEREWEGGMLPDLPSKPGPADAPENQLRDPYVLELDGALWLFYACAGESGIAVAQLCGS